VRIILLRIEARNLSPEKIIERYDDTDTTAKHAKIRGGKRYRYRPTQVLITDHRHAGDFDLSAKRAIGDMRYSQGVVLHVNQ
jgi:hypothetical protein